MRRGSDGLTSWERRRYARRWRHGVGSKSLVVKDQPVRSFIWLVRWNGLSRSAVAELWYTVPARTTCRLGWHSSVGKRVYKFNGGNGAWLCRYCRLIMKYGHERW